MADYRFDKPWASESQNVQEFNEQEWGTGIVEKSLVSSAQVNGVMQAVTKRFLDLEAVEDRQYRYDFVVENQADWNKFVNGNTGTAQSVLIRKGQVWTATSYVKLRRVGVIVLEEGAEIRFNAQLQRQSLSPAIISGGVVRGNLSNCRVLHATLTATVTTKYENTAIENSYVYTESSTVLLSGGHYSQSVINAAGIIRDAKLTDCKIQNIKELDNCIIVRCEIPTNTKLTGCTVIDCDYSVTIYTENLVTRTTFRNCEVTINIVNESQGNIIIDENTCFTDSKLRLNAKNANEVHGNAYDCEFLNENNNLTLINKLCIYGNSYLIVTSSSISVFESISGRMRYSQILTDTPFYRGSSIDNYYNYTATTYLVPGAICRLTDTNSRQLRTNSFSNNYFLQLLGELTNTQSEYGNARYIHTCKFNQRQDGYIKLTI